ncbi:Hypothetical protein NTJ_09115 [Nesidiocoris tenuis]|uniref:Uncharacterized protein n=1 Tax=Nesidiocoris tenuis TaxID=355587 RepID=A0ABN7AVT5_9HEMI|nr:Hypothetical protein NTJ_09115 [Nesidiocoris tenuis]
MPRTIGFHRKFSETFQHEFAWDAGLQNRYFYQKRYRGIIRKESFELTSQGYKQNISEERFTAWEHGGMLLRLAVFNERSKNTARTWAGANAESAIVVGDMHSTWNAISKL